MNCLKCGIEFDPKRDTAKFCSANCRVAYNREVSVTSGISVTDPKPVSVTFKFTVGYNRKPGDEGYDEDTAKARKKVREEIYWYDVPLAAIPVMEKAWPKMPEYMNGRQYFLWWKNNFETNQDPEKGEIGQPVILNPFPAKDNVTYIKAGAESRRWGA